MPKKFTILFSISLLAVLIAFTGGISYGSQSSSERIKIIIDTDIGEDIDDILVTAYALASPEFEVLAITTVDGNVEERTRVARKVAVLFGRPEVQVAAGYVRSMPLDDIHYERGRGGIRYGEVAPDEEGLPEVSPLKADELIAKLAMQYPGEVNLLTIGSMSNVGHLLIRYPEAAKKLKRIITNGGYIDMETGVQRIGWNLRYDPVAAMIAARSELPWVLLSESTSRYASPRAEDVARLEAAGLPSSELLTRAIDFWHKNKKDATGLPHVSDLNVFAYLLGLIETQKGNIFIEIGPRGAVPDFRAELDPEGRIDIGWIIPREKATALREVFIERLVSPPE